MAVIRSLSISVKARTKQLQKGFSAARKSVAKFAMSIKSVGKKVAKFALAFTAAGLAIGAVFIRRNLKVVDQIGKLSDRLGFTTETLISLKRAAELAGNEFGTIVVALQRFNVRIAEADLIGGTVAKTLKAIGLEGEKFRALSLDEMFLKVADAIQAQGNQLDRGFIANQLFGRSGRELINVLQAGSKGFSDLRKQAELNNELLSREQVAAIEQVNDAWREMKAQLDVLTNSFLVEFSPAIVKVLKKMKNLAVASKALGSIAKRAFVFVASIAAGFLNFFRGIEAQFFKAKATLLEFISLLASLLSRLPTAGLGLLGVKDPEPFKKMLAGIGLFSKEIDKLSKESFGKFVKMMDEFDKGKPGQDFLERIQKMVEAFSKLNFEIARKGKEESKNRGRFLKFAKRTGQFREIDVSRIAIGGAGKRKVQQVNDPQLKEVVKNQRIMINALIGGELTAVAN